jgi:Transposase DDE domain
MPVCKNARGTSHRVFKQLARWSKTTQGWFYGLKLHLECDRDGHLTRVAITMGNGDDRNLVDFFTAWMRGGIFIADAGYVDHQRGEKLAREKGIYYLTGVRKNMKRLATFAQLFLLRLRQIVETVFSVLKERLLLIRSTHRSVVAGFSHFVTCLLGYCLKKADF